MIKVRGVLGLSYRGRKTPSFVNDWEFLSMAYVHDFRFMKRTFICADSAYIATKYTGKFIQRLFSALTGYESRSLEKRVCAESHGVKSKKELVDTAIDRMMDVQMNKFANKELKGMLLKTGAEEIVYNNNSFDTYWGMCNGEGENNLGKILMAVRRLHQ